MLNLEDIRALRSLTSRVDYPRNRNVGALSTPERLILGDKCGVWDVQERLNDVSSRTIPRNE